MICKRPAPLVLVALLGAGLLLVSCEDAGAGKKKKRDKKKKQAAVEAPVPGAGNCKAPAPASPELAAGLEKYMAGDWRDAIGPLSAWAKDPEAAKDPAAARGFYSLGYAYSATRQQRQSDQWYQRAQPLLEKSALESPNLEDLYYLASLYRTRQQPAKQLETVSKTLAMLESGEVCQATDGDDDFRVSRLLSFAGRDGERRARLEAAVEKYDRGEGKLASYHALALQELAEHARREGDAAKWETYLTKAAALDPAIPNLHRNLGLAMLKRGAIDEAAAYWRKNWRRERNDGNGLVYNVRILRAYQAHAQRFGEEHRIGNLAEFTKDALEQNAIYEARAMAEASGKMRAQLGDDERAAAQLAHDVAHYRMVQLLTEYLSREHAVQEFALQNGLLPAIHGTGLPKR